MKLEVIKDKFLEAVSLADRVSSKHVSLPILSSIIFEVKNGVLAVKATNLDVGVEVFLPVKSNNDWTLAVSGSVLKSFLSTITSKNITCEIEGALLKIKSNEGEVALNTSSTEDFPVIPKISGGKKIILDSKLFLDGLRSVFWAASVSTIKPELSSVFIKEEGGDLVFVATDSFRLAEKKIKNKKASDFEPILIPFKNTIEIIRTFENYTGDLDITMSKNQLSITTPSIHLSSRVVDGNFPDYRQIIPKEFTTKATVLKQDLLQTLKLSSYFSDSFNQIILSMNPDRKVVTISTKNTIIGESNQEAKGVVEGEEVAMPFNYKYILDCMQSIDGESVVLKVAGAGKPLVVSPATNNSFTYLVMSMNR